MGSLFHFIWPYINRLSSCTALREGCGRSKKKYFLQKAGDGKGERDCSQQQHPTRNSCFYTPIKTIRENAAERYKTDLFHYNYEHYNAIDLNSVMCFGEIFTFKEEDKIGIHYILYLP